MSWEDVDPPTAHTRLGDGWRYVDVRSPQEFAQGHPAGLVNIPVLFMGPLGMQPNADFVAVVQKHFATDQPLLLGCKSGGRSARAAGMLAQAGYTTLANVAGGFSGSQTVAGWKTSDLPVSDDVTGVGWEDLK